MKFKIHITTRKVLLINLLLIITLVCFGQKEEEISIIESGKFVVGCNYWASHAGTNMWKDWQSDVVEADLEQMENAGIQVIRIFPLWPDFQPIHQFYNNFGNLKDIRFKDSPLPKTGPGKDGISVEALSYFKEFADLAYKHNIKLVVGLVTGWMSGQLFVPQALEGKDILTDPTSIMWQVKLVRTMVHEFKYHPAILAWDLGNECNVMDQVPSSQAAYVWTASITNAIKAEDASRPVVSGMHSLSSGSDALWKIQDQAELTDLLTTHPYPFWTPHTDQDPANTIRTIMHSTAETRFYGDVGGKPCLVEETGIMGPMEANEKTKADFLRTLLFNNWAHNCHGLMWWCAYDQNHLDFTPYEWNAVERDLGLFRTDRSPKPVVAELSNFRKFIDQLPFETLPEFKKEAVCILTDGQDQWGVAYSSFILAKQAGFDIEFQHGNQSIKDAELYMIPSIKGLELIDRTDWLKILENVKNGAILYVSFDKSFLSPFIDEAGIEVVSSQSRNEPASFISTDKHFQSFEMPAGRKLNIVTTTASVLAREKDGNPIFTVNKYGKGKIYYLGIPIEINLTNTPGAFTDGKGEFYKVYQTFASELIHKRRVAEKDDPMVGITEHELDNHTSLVILINYSPQERRTKLKLKEGWKITEVLYGENQGANTVKLNQNDACVLKIVKN